jgi:S1-C subfamily serine protease
MYGNSTVMFDLYTFLCMGASIVLCTRTSNFMNKEIVMPAFRIMVLGILWLSLASCGLLNDVTQRDAPPSRPATDDQRDNLGDAPDTKVVAPVRSLSINDVINATVRIGILDQTWKEVGHGSGSIIDARGLILTNFHVIGDNESGRYHNADGISYIYLTLDPRDPPKLQFIAQVVDADAGRDLAVLRIIATTNGEPPADCLNLPVVTMNSDVQVEIGKKVTSVGYSGVGGNTVSIASGQVVGFEQVTMSSSSTRSFEAIKYDASDSRGASGGPIVNDANEQVAVVFAGWSDQGDSLGYARSITLARDLIASAQLVRIPGCNGAEAARIIGPQTAQANENTTNTNTNTSASSSDSNQTSAKVSNIRGYITDRATNKPIANASVVLLKPGYRWNQVDYDRYEDYIWTFAQTDARGEYVLSVTQEMLATQTGIGFYADGYKAYLSDSERMITFFDESTGNWKNLSFEYP